MRLATGPGILNTIGAPTQPCREDRLLAPARVDFGSANYLEKLKTGFWGAPKTETLGSAWACLTSPTDHIAPAYLLPTCDDGAQPCASRNEPAYHVA